MKREKTIRKIINITGKAIACLTAFAIVVTGWCGVPMSDVNAEKDDICAFAETSGTVQKPDSAIRGQEISDGIVLLKSYFCQADGEKHEPEVLSVKLNGHGLTLGYYETRIYKISMKPAVSTSTEVVETDGEGTAEEVIEQIEMDKENAEETEEGADSSGEPADSSENLNAEDTDAVSDSMEAADSEPDNQPSAEELAEIELHNEMIRLVEQGEYEAALALDPKVAYEPYDGDFIYPGDYRIVVFGKGWYKGYCFASYSILGKPQKVTAEKTKVTKALGDKSFSIALSTDGDGTGFRYSTSNPEVVTVDESGMITPAGVGVANIVARTDGDVLSQSAKVNISARVTPKAPKWTAKDAITGRAVLHWNNSRNGAEKYEIQYSESPDFKPELTKTATVMRSTLKVQTKRIYSLSKSKTYYIRIRSVAQVSDPNKNIRVLKSPWSTVKKVPAVKK